MEFHIFYGRAVIDADEIYEVELYDPQKELMLNRGYIHNGSVYVYRGELPPDNSLTNPTPKHGLYKTPSGNHIFKEGTPKEAKLFRLKNVTQMDPDAFLTNFLENKDDFVNEDDLRFISNNSKIFTVQEKDNDDFLKRAVKQAINQKQIALENYSANSATKHEIPNLKTTVMKENPMTYQRFMQWADLLKLDWKFIVFDGGDERSPLKEEIVLESKDFK